MSSIKRHKPEQYRRTQEIIRQSRVAKRIQGLIQEVTELIAEESRSRGRSFSIGFLHYPHAAGTPTRPYRSPRLIRANELVAIIASIRDRPTRLRFEHVFTSAGSVPQQPPPLPVAPPRGPSRARDYEYPPEIPNQWSPCGHRMMLGRSGLDRETENRHEAARRWSAASHGVGGILDFRLIPGRHIDAHWHHGVCKVPATSSLDFRTWHHAECASSISSRPCDCSPAFLVRAGVAVFSIGRDGTLTPHADQPLTRDRIRWFDPSSPPVESGIRQGFQGEYDRDRFGRLLVPMGIPFLEFTNGTISFAEAGLPIAKIQTCENLPHDE